jgi:hypothetical protein
MKWFKFYGQDYLSDPKMLSLSASERSCWITLLSYSSINDNGMITYLDEQQLMLQAGINFTCDEWDRTVGVLEKLVKLEMITLDNGMITVINWQKRQETNLTSYERVKRFRQKKQDDNAKITLEEKRIEKKRIYKNTDVLEKVSKKSFGELEQVKLTDDEYSKLIDVLGQNNVDILIFELDTYIASKNVKYKNHYATILNWAKRKADQKTNYQNKGRGVA